MRTYYGTYFGQVTSKKNSKTPFKKRNGTLGVRMKKEARDQEKAMSEAFSSDFDEQKFAKGYFDNAELEVIVEFYNKDAHRRDIDNQLTSVMDALVKGGVIPDDSQAHVVQEVVRFAGVDSVDPRAEVTIREYKKSKENYGTL